MTHVKKVAILYNYYCRYKNKEDYTIYTTLIFKLLHLKKSEVLYVKERYINNKLIEYDVKLKPAAVICKKCDSSNIVIKEWKTKSVKAKIYDDIETIINFRFPRYKCKQCGATFAEKNNHFCESRLSTDTIIKILDDLCSWNKTYYEIADRFNVSNTTIINILDKYVSDTKHKLPKVLCIDEIYIGKNRKKPYACVLLNHTTGKLIDVIEGREKLTLRNYFLSKSQAERDSVEYITMDMWDTYLTLADNCFPNATVAVDSFHVMENFGRALHSVKCRTIDNYDKGTVQYYLLKKYKHLLYSSKKVSYKKRYNYKLKNYVSNADILRLMLSISEELKVAYNFYHAYQHFNKTATIENAEDKFDRLTEDVTEIVKIPEFREVISTIQKWKTYIINSFNLVDGRRLSNGPMEGTNNRIKRLKKAMNGIDNFQRFRLRALLCINKTYTLAYHKKDTIRRKYKKRGKYKKKRSDSGES